MEFRKTLPLLLLACLSFPAHAGDQVGFLTQIEGKVSLFTHPSKTLHKDADSSAPRALFEGEYYKVKDAKPGDRLELGNILRTAPGAKARVIYPNGDQFTVGSGTAYRIFWTADAPNAETKMNLMYGKIRAVVEKGGPHSKLKIKTASATMGVRGTDFFIADGGPDGGTEISIIRGAVAVTPEPPRTKEGKTAVAQTEAPKPVEIKAGETASIAPPPAPAAPAKTEGKGEEKAAAQTPPPAPVVELRKTTQQELTSIQKTSQVQQMKKEDLEKAAPPEVAKQIEHLQEKAVQTTMKDIKTHDPKLYAQLEQKKEEIKSPDDVNATALREIAKEAPKAPENHKPYKAEMEDLENGAYDKYFKQAE